jgi:hypothetical protein
LASEKTKNKSLTPKFMSIPSTILTLNDGNHVVLQSTDYENGYYVYFRCDASGVILPGETSGRGVSTTPNAPTEAGAATAIGAALGLS